VGLGWSRYTELRDDSICDVCEADAQVTIKSLAWGVCSKAGMCDVPDRHIGFDVTLRDGP
jgi:hypothetical protein